MKRHMLIYFFMHFFISMLMSGDKECSYKDGDSYYEKEQDSYEKS